jgi:hypothetical protein
MRFERQCTKVLECKNKLRFQNKIVKEIYSGVVDS